MPEKTVDRIVFYIHQQKKEEYKFIKKQKYGAVRSLKITEEVFWNAATRVVEET